MRNPIMHSAVAPTSQPRVQRAVVDQRTVVVAGGLLGVALSIFAVLVYRVWVYTVDDAFITMRYAQNLAAGHGPVWNIDVPPTEGYTTFLWMLLLAIPHMLHLDPVLFAKLVGVSCMLLTFAVCFGTVAWSTSHRRGTKEWVTAAGAVCLLTAWAPTAVHAVSGMETALYTLLLTVFFVGLAVLATRPVLQSMLVLALIGFSVGLTRPEGNLAVVVGFAALFIVVDRPARMPLLWSILSGYVLPSVVYWSWRWWYYDAPLPLPFYIKTVHQGLLAGAPDVLDLLSYLAVHFGLLFVLGVMRLRRIWLPASAAALALVGFWLLPAHIMGYNWRFVFPLVPLFIIVAAHGFEAVSASCEGASTSFGGMRSQLVTIIVCGLMTLGLMRDTPARLIPRIAEGAGLQQAHIRLGSFLATLPVEHKLPLLAMGDAGAAPYYSQWTTIDHFGLNDRVIARTGRHDPHYVLDQKPDVVVLISRYAHTFESPLPYEQGLYEEVVARGMVRVNVLTYLPAHHLWIYTWPNSSTAHSLSKLPNEAATVE